MFPQLGGGSGGNESNGEQQVKICSSPAVQPGSWQAKDQYWATAQGLGTPDIVELLKQEW